MLPLGIIKSIWDSRLIRADDVIKERYYVPGSADPTTQYERLIPSDRMHYMETYNASEGFFGLQDDPSDKSMLLILDYGVFYEFIPTGESGRPDDGIAIPLEAVETGVNYAMIITTAGRL